MNPIYINNISDFQNVFEKTNYDKPISKDTQEVIYKNHSYVKFGKIQESHRPLWRATQFLKAIIASLFAITIAPLFFSNYRDLVKHSWKKGLTGKETVNIYALKTLQMPINHLIDKKREVEEVKQLLITNPDRINQTDKQGKTLLHSAIENNNEHLIKFLLNQGAEDKANSKGNFSIHYAAQKGHLEAVKALLEHNPALLNVPGYRGLTPLHFAAQSGNETLVTWLLLDKGAEDKADSNGSFPLHFAAQEGHLEAVKALLEHNLALLNQPGDEGSTPLHFAAQSGNETLVTWLLLDKGAEDKADSNGSFPLHFAAQEGHLEAVKALLEHNPALLNQPGDKGLTLLHYAAGCGKEALIRWLLLDKGAEHKTSSEGFFPIHHAVHEGHLEAAKALVENNPALLNVPGCRGATPLHLAAKKGNEALVRWLLGQGAENKTNSQGHFPVDVVNKEKHIDIIKILSEHPFAPLP